MSSEYVIPPSVDLTGDLSQKPRIEPHHRSPVGPAILTPRYRSVPKRDGEYNEGMNSNPLKCVIVLGTPTTSGKTEYRVGKFSNLPQLHEGLCVTLHDQFMIRKEVALKLFGESAIYSSRINAIAAAEEKYPDNLGVKVMGLPFSFPH